MPRFDPGEEMGQFQMRVEDGGVGGSQWQAGRESTLVHGNTIAVTIPSQAHAQLKMTNRADEHWLNAKAEVQFHPAWTSREPRKA